jgi:hypothetical protein
VGKRKTVAVLTATALAGAAFVTGSQSAEAHSREQFFNRTVTFPVFQNRPAGDAVEDETVTVVGDYVLVVVNTSKSFTEPSGRVDVIRIADRTRIRSIDLGGQPDSIAVDQKAGHVAIAIEDERYEEATPPGGEEGDLPQLPAGFVQLIDLAKSPASWTAHKVALVNPDGTALKSFKDAGLDTPIDPEPE